MSATANATLSDLNAHMNGVALEILAVRRIASLLETMSDKGYSNAGAGEKHGDTSAEWTKNGGPTSLGWAGLWRTQRPAWRRWRRRSRPAW